MSQRSKGNYSKTIYHDEVRHDKYNSIVELKLKLTAISYLFVGSGIERINEGLNIDKILDFNISDMNLENLQKLVGRTNTNFFLPMDYPVRYENYSNNAYKYAIPGSTLKGFTRSRCELYDIENVCYIITDSFDDKCKTHHELFGIDKSTIMKTNESCWICNLFGSKKRGKSRLIFTDAILRDNKYAVPIKLKSFGNSLKMAFKPDATFTFDIKMINTEMQDEVDILNALGIIEGETRLLGFSKYREQELGDNSIEIFGVVKFDINRVIRYETDNNGIFIKIAYNKNNKEKLEKLPKDEKYKKLKELYAEYLNKQMEKWKKLDSRLFTQDEDEKLIRKLPSNSRKPW